MKSKGLNPYFIGLSTLILKEFINEWYKRGGLNPYFIGLSTLISLTLSLTSLS